jgi:DNA-binding Lrp family transcriptional regulator
MSEEKAFEAFSLLEVTSGYLEKVVAEANLLSKTESYRIFGTYDVITRIVAKSYEEREAKADRLTEIEGVKKVSTYSVSYKLYGREIKRDNIFAFVLFRLKPQLVNAFCNEFPSIAQISEAATLRGDYDAIAIVHVKNIAELSGVVNILQRVTGVEKTVTCIVYP